MSDYDKTPSNYNTEEMFQKYLGQTSYYNTLQNNVISISSLINPDFIVDLGCGTGSTTERLSVESDCRTIGIDRRLDPITSERNNTDSLSYICADMCDVTDILGNTILDVDLITMLYSFHHIQDPLSEKKNFLQNLYTNLRSGSYICIAETFLGESTVELDELWKLRSLEGYSSTFWSTLSGIDSESIKRSREIGDFSREHEQEAGENVIAREGEYLIDRDWLEKKAADVGFDVVLSEPCNALGECLVLLEVPNNKQEN